MPHKDPEKRREWEKKYRERKKENDKKYYQKHKEKVNEYQKKYYEENKEEILKKHKKYWEENKEKMMVKNKKWLKNNKEKNQKYQKKYREKHKEEIQKYYEESKGGNYKNPTINDEFVKILEVYGKIFESRLFSMRTIKRSIGTLQKVLSSKARPDGGFLNLLKFLKIEVTTKNNYDYIKQSDIPKIQEFLNNHMTTADVRNKYTVSYWKIKNLRESGKLKSKKIGQFHWYKIEDIINLNKSDWGRKNKEER